MQHRVRREDAALRRTERTRGDTCLSDAQLAAVAKITSDYKPGFAVAGMDTFPRWPLLEGALFRERSNWGQVPQPSNPLSGKEPLLYTAGDQTAKFIITRNPKLDTMTFDPKQYQSRIATVASIMDVTDVSLEKFKAKGGKIILTHGTVDDFITPHNTELYYQRQVKQFGQAGVDSFMRFYMIPGFGHGFGPFNAKIDSLTALQDVGREGAGASGPHGDRRQPQRESLASAVRVAEVAEVHRRSWQRRQRRQLHLRGTVDGQRDPSSYNRPCPEVYRAVALMLNTADSGVRVPWKTYWERADYWAYDRERSREPQPCDHVRLLWQYRGYSIDCSTQKGEANACRRIDYRTRTAPCAAGFRAGVDRVREQSGPLLGSGTR